MMSGGSAARWVAVAWGLLTLTAACGSDDDDDSQEPDAGQTPDAAEPAADAGDAGQTDAGQTDAGDAGGEAEPCEHRTELTGGYACAVAPSATGDGISDEFGYHAVGVPDDVSPSTPLLVYLKGTLALPYDPDAEEYPGSSLNILQEALNNGRLALMIAYDRLPPVALTCQDDLACYGGLRDEIIEGVEGGDPGDVRHIRPPNDVFSRLDALLAHLNAAMPGELPATVDWATATVGGHSQGAGHAVYIGKQLRQVQRVCAFAGPADGNSAGEIADWITEPTMMTPLAAMRGLVHQDDDEGIVAAFEALGLEQDVSYRLVTDLTDDPHNFVVQDAAMSDDRVWACYE